MSKEIKFVDGLRAYKPHANAPDFVKAALEINISELQGWLNAQEGEKVRLDLKESKSGTYYCSVNDFTPDPSRGNGGSDYRGSTATGNSGPPPSEDFGPPPSEDYGPPTSDDFDDDIPF